MRIKLCQLFTDPPLLVYVNKAEEIKVLLPCVKITIPGTDHRIDLQFSTKDTSINYK